MGMKIEKQYVAAFRGGSTCRADESVSESRFAVKAVEHAQVSLRGAFGAMYPVSVFSSDRRSYLDLLESP